MAGVLLLLETGWSHTTIAISVLDYQEGGIGCEARRSKGMGMRTINTAYLHLFLSRARFRAQASVIYGEKCLSYSLLHQQAIWRRHV